MVVELDGLAKFEDDIDGKFNVYNYCLAEEYAIAIISEDFESLGAMSYELIENITYWLNYDGVIGEEDVDIIKGIKDGTVNTINDRTFIDAIYEKKQVDIAKMYIERGVINSKLLLTCILYGKGELPKTILNEVHYFIKEKEDYIRFLNDVFSLIEQEFNKMDSVEETKQYLSKIRQAVSNIKYPKKYGEINISIKEYNWGKQYKKIRL